LTLCKKRNEQTHGCRILRQESQKPGPSSEPVAELGQIEQGLIRCTGFCDLGDQSRTEATHYFESFWAWRGIDLAIPHREKVLIGFMRIRKADSFKPTDDGLLPVKILPNRAHLL